MTTIYDVARRAGVSTGTVSRFLNEHGYVSESARQRIKVAIQELGFTPSGIARGLTNKRTYMIGVVVSDLLNPFIPEVVRGIQDYADEAGYCALIYNTDGVGSREARVLQLLYERRVDGLIIMSPETQEGNQQLLELHQQGLPIVLIGRQLSVPVDRVSTNTYLGACEAMQHLIAFGHRRIAFIIGTGQNIKSGRHRGYLDALHQAGIASDEQLIVEASLAFEGGIAACHRLLRIPDPPTAVFCVNDITAIGVIQGAHLQGVQVPEDLSVVGFDDIASAVYMQPPLTTVAQPKPLLGRTATEVLLARIEQGETLPAQEIRLPCTLVIRQSTRRR